jgi:hypothetical protein
MFTSVNTALNYVQEAPQFRGLHDGASVTIVERHEKGLGISWYLSDASSQRSKIASSELMIHQSISKKHDYSIVSALFGVLIERSDHVVTNAGEAILGHVTLGGRELGHGVRLTGFILKRKTPT